MGPTYIGPTTDKKKKKKKRLLHCPQHYFNFFCDQSLLLDHIIQPLQSKKKQDLITEATNLVGGFVRHL